MSTEPKDVAPEIVPVPASTTRHNHSESGEFFPAEGNTFSVVVLDVTPDKVDAVQGLLNGLENQCVTFDHYRWPGVNVEAGDVRAMVRVGMNCNPAAPMPVPVPIEE